MSKDTPRILAFDFPLIPVLGVLLLSLIVFNDRPLASVIFDKEGKPLVSMIGACVLFLGTAGITFAKLILFCLHGNFSNARARSLKSKTNRFSSTTSEWFDQLRNELVPIERKKEREGTHDTSKRKRLSDMTPGQVHATLHALEISCRRKFPEIASQIEYFYSMFVIFFVLGSGASAFPLLKGFEFFMKSVKNPICDPVTQNVTGSALVPATVDALTGLCSHLNVPWYMLIIDSLLVIFCMSAVIRARRFKEHLRTKLMNSCRLEVIDNLSAWFQVELRGATDGVVAASMNRVNTDSEQV